VVAVDGVPATAGPAAATIRARARQHAVGVLLARVRSGRRGPRRRGGTCGARRPGTGRRGLGDGRHVEHCRDHARGHAQVGCYRSDATPPLRQACGTGRRSAQVERRRGHVGGDPGRQRDALGRARPGTRSRVARPVVVVAGVETGEVDGSVRASVGQLEHEGVGSHVLGRHTQPAPVARQWIHVGAQHHLALQSRGLGGHGGRRRRRFGGGRSRVWRRRLWWRRGHGARLTGRRRCAREREGAKERGRPRGQSKDRHGRRYYPMT
jgi:hypothetical protein